MNTASKSQKPRRGRPPGRTYRQPPLQVSLTEEDFSYVEKLGRDRGTSTSEAARAIISKFTNGLKKLPEP